MKKAVAYSRAMLVKDFMTSEAITDPAMKATYEIAGIYGDKDGNEYVGTFATCDKGDFSLMTRDYPDLTLIHDDCKFLRPITSENIGELFQKTKESYYTLMPACDGVHGPRTEKTAGLVDFIANPHKFDKNAQPTLKEQRDLKSRNLAKLAYY